MAQGCSPIHSIAFLKEVEEAGIEVQLSNDKSIAGMFFADDFL